MNHDELVAYCLAKPGAEPDEPWEGDLVARLVDTSYDAVVATLPKRLRPAPGPA